jgi:hypothetical protein
VALLRRRRAFLHRVASVGTTQWWIALAADGFHIDAAKLQLQSLGARSEMPAQPRQRKITLRLRDESRGGEAPVIGGAELTTKAVAAAHHFPEVGVPLFWPFGLALTPLELTDRTLKFLAEIARTQIERPAPHWTTPHRVALELHTLTLRDFSTRSNARPVLVLPPHAGHSLTIADFQPGQSLVATLLQHGCPRVLVTDWRSATPEALGGNRKVARRRMNVRKVEHRFDPSHTPSGIHRAEPSLLFCRWKSAAHRSANGRLPEACATSGFADEATAVVAA